jgi:hypothetical protein
MRLHVWWVVLAVAACRSEPPKPPPEPGSTCEPVEFGPSLAREGGACVGDWCWGNPLPVGTSLQGVYSPRPGVAWIAGDAGVLLRAEGTQVTALASPTNENLTDIWGSSDADVWAVGTAGTLLHWDGFVWSPRNSPAGSTALRAVSGVSATSAWAGGAGGLLLHWDGTSWAAVPSSTTADVADIWAAGPTEAWVAAGNTALRCTPSGCVTVPGPSASFAPKRVSGAAPDDVYFLSGEREVLRWNSSTWETLDLGRVRAVYDLRVTGPGELWAAYDVILDFTVNPYRSGVRHWSQGRVVEEVLHAPGTNVVGEYAEFLRYFPAFALAVTSREDLWAVGFHGRLSRREGARDMELMKGTLGGYLFTSIAQLPGTQDGSTPTSLATGRVGQRLWVAGPGELWTATTALIAGNMGSFHLEVYRHQGGRDTQLLSKTRNSGRVFSPLGIHGSSTSNVWLVDWSGLYRFDGEQWTQLVERPAGSGGFPYTGPVWAFADDDVWFGGRDGLHHWNGSAMEDVPAPGFVVNALWASWKGHLWAVGAQDGKPRADLWDGSTWTQVPLPEGTGVRSLVDVTGRCPGEVYLIGDRSAVFRWDGAQLHTVPVPIPLNMLSATRMGPELWVSGAAPGARALDAFNNMQAIIRTPWQRAP